jgi:hypothetical protein
VKVTLDSYDGEIEVISVEFGIGTSVLEAEVTDSYSDSSVEIQTQQWVKDKT